MTIINPFPNTLTNGTTADASQVMANFNECLNDVNNNAAHNGANSDITSLSGLSTPLSVSQGGTSLPTGFVVPQGRLTLASAVPVMQSSVSAATVIYYTPYLGQTVPIWNGTTFVPTVFSELTNTLTDATKNPSATAASNPYDLFVWSDAGTIRLSRGPSWYAGTGGSSTARGAGVGSTTLQRTQGLLVNAYAIANGPTAGYGTYVGSFYAGASATAYWTPVTSGAGGGQSLAWLWNMYNRVLVSASCVDTTANHTYTSTTLRAFDGSTGNSILYFCGLAEDNVSGSLTGAISTATSGYGLLTMGLDSSTATASGAMQAICSAIGTATSVMAIYAAPMQLGLHTLYAIEGGSGTNASTFSGSPLEQLFLMGKF